MEKKGAEKASSIEMKTDRSDSGSKVFSFSIPLIPLCLWPQQTLSSFKNQIFTILGIQVFLSSLKNLASKRASSLINVSSVSFFPNLILEISTYQLVLENFLTIALHTPYTYVISEHNYNTKDL